MIFGIGAGVGVGEGVSELSCVLGRDIVVEGDPEGVSKPD